MNGDRRKLLGGIGIHGGGDVLSKVPPPKQLCLVAFRCPIEEVCLGFLQSCRILDARKKLKSISIWNVGHLLSTHIKFIPNISLVEEVTHIPKYNCCCEGAGGGGWDGGFFLAQSRK